MIIHINLRTAISLGCFAPDGHATQGEAFQYNRFLRKKQRLSRECCRPYARKINARENIAFLALDVRLSGAKHPSTEVLFYGQDSLGDAIAPTFSFITLI
ncbi:MAG: hypothetical protein F6J93_04610 [Oscillatoria sp. SIO1A7]|nr:hypothetical protein [Oscillatoria sp. SIO1A7]